VELVEAEKKQCQVLFLLIHPSINNVLKKSAHAEHGEEGAQKQGFGKSMGNNFQDSL
jgi:hypothetical protein